MRKKRTVQRVDRFSLVLENVPAPQVSCSHMHERGALKKQWQARLPQDPLPNLPCRPTDLQDMSQMILRTKGPDRLPAGYEIVLYISMSDSDKVGVFYVESESSPKPPTCAATALLSGYRFPGTMEPTE